jgi:hypothetical protein
MWIFFSDLRVSKPSYACKMIKSLETESYRHIIIIRYIPHNEEIMIIRLLLFASMLFDL